MVKKITMMQQRSTVDSRCRLSDTKIIIIIIKNVKIRVTLSWITLQGHFTESWDYC